MFCVHLKIQNIPPIELFLHKSYAALSSYLFIYLIEFTPH